MSTRWANAQLPDQSGRTAIVTGATSGLGLVTARELARVGARVVLAVRDPAKGEHAAATMAGQLRYAGSTWPIWPPCAPSPLGGPNRWMS